MSIYTVSGRHEGREGDDTISVERLGLIGYIGTWYWKNDLMKFPLPMVAIDGTPKITYFDTATRLEGLLPSESDENHLIRGNWTAQVDIGTLQEHGEGEVYLGNANTPSDTTGYIFKNAIPFNPELELAFVENLSDYEVLRIEEYDGIESHLIYADATALDGLGRIFKP